MTLKSVFTYLLHATLGLLIALNAHAEQPEIAITIDDLPFVGPRNNTPGDVNRTSERFNRLMEPLVNNKIPVTGFVIAGSIGKGEWDLLEKFHEAGFQLGNHTYSHPNLNTMGTEKYINNIDKADQILSNILTTPKYFRYPYLAEGSGDKRRKVYKYLEEHGYTIAPVTIDSKDYRFNSQLLAINWKLREKNVDSVKKRYLAYIARQTENAEKMDEKSGKKTRQILLIHANLLNSFCMEDIVEYYKQRGYKFITLDEALANPDATVINSATAEQ